MGRYFATVARGLEELAVTELTELGAKKIKPGFCGVEFEGDRRLLYHVNLWARLPFRVLQRVDDFACEDAEDLYHGIQNLNWSYFLTPDYSIAVTATGKNRELNHSHFTALQVKNAIVDQQRKQFGERSSVDPESPDVRINVHIDKNHCVVSLDSSGQSLHRRGYRPAVGAAPLKESLAAALIRLSDWTPEQAFFDPLCGSGTLPLEASLKALNRAPGLFRESFGFQTWKDFDQDLWQSLVAEAETAQQHTLDIPILGSDRNEVVVEQARVNAIRCEVDQFVSFNCCELSEIEAPTDSGVIFCNPPYGERLGNDTDLGAFYKALGTVLKQQFKGWVAYVLSGNKALSRTIGLRSCERFPVYNGSIPCQLMKYELF